MTISESEPVQPSVADRRQLVLSTREPVQWRTRAAGIFLFLPFLAEMQFDTLVRKAGYPGSEMIPADAAILSLLAMKLLRKERLSHMDDFCLDEALGLFAGLNVLPKKSFATDYSYRTTRNNQPQLLGEWVKKISPILLPEATAFSLDFHSIPYRGDEAELENHHVPCRVKACPSIQSFFAQEHEKQVFCYANANITRDEQAQEATRFVDDWLELTGTNPEWLYFDSKLTTYAELSELNSRSVWFVTIRRRGSSMMKRLAETPNDQWTGAVIDIPKRRHKRIQYLEEMVQLSGYAGAVRQIAAKGLGRSQPTLFITNNEKATVREIIMNYARRNRIEDGIETNVGFFHLDSLSSEVRLNVDLAVTLTVIANGCYRWLASKLKGFDKAKARELSRRFVETSGSIEVGANRTLHVTFDRRSHNPIMREAALGANSPSVAWLRRHKIEFHFR